MLALGYLQHYGGALNHVLPDGGPSPLQDHSIMGMDMTASDSEDDDKKIIEQKIKNQFEILKRIDSYIGTTNTKCTLIMSYCVGFTALALSLLGRLSLSVENTATAVTLGLSYSYSLLFAFICMIMACLTIFPATRSTPARNSLIFFGDISAHKDPSSYISKIHSTSESDFLKDLAGQTHALSVIAGKKFKIIQYLSLILYLHFACATAFLITFSLHHIK
jgi:hypothetical protein